MTTATRAAFAASCQREFAANRVNRFLHAHLALAAAAGFLPLFTPDDASGAAPLWVLHAVLYCLSLSSLLLGLSSAHAEADEFPLLFAQPAPRWVWLLGKAAAVTVVLGTASLLLILPAALVGGLTLVARLHGVGRLGCHARACRRRTRCWLLGPRSGAWIADRHGRLVRDALRNGSPAACRLRGSMDPRTARPLGRAPDGQPSRCVPDHRALQRGAGRVCRARCRRTGAMVDHARMDLADDARRAVGRRRIRDRARRRTSPSRCLKHTLPGAKDRRPRRADR